jgi:hypothetical protein
MTIMARRMPITGSTETRWPHPKFPQFSLSHLGSGCVIVKLCPVDEKVPRSSQTLGPNFSLQISSKSLIIMRQAVK